MLQVGSGTSHRSTQNKNNQKGPKTELIASRVVKNYSRCMMWRYVFLMLMCRTWIRNRQAGALLWFDLVASSTSLTVDIDRQWPDGRVPCLNRRPVPSHDKPLYSATLPRRLALTSPLKRFYSEPFVAIPREPPLPFPYASVASVSPSPAVGYPH